MKAFIVVCSLVAVSVATSSQWNQFKLTYNKTYQNASEELIHRETFYENVKKIEEHNKLYDQGLVSYQMGVNKFADWTQEEFVTFLTMSKRTTLKATSTYSVPADLELPTSIDWRDKGAVTDVKDQGSCGACWAFSATGALEGQLAIRKGSLVSLSEQELVDCSTANSGCGGGLMDAGFEYVQNNGLTTEANYPYETKDGRCRRGSLASAVTVSGYTDIPSGSESSLQSAVATVGPISVAVDATNWSPYAKGIFTGTCGSTLQSLNHGVLAVGYGTTSNGGDYWIIKNSWGSTWGESGYIRIPRGQNKCGIAIEASYPLLSSSTNVILPLSLCFYIFFGILGISMF